MKEFVKRMKEEAKELSEKLEKLEDFLETEKFRGLARSEKDLLVEQRKIMKEYLFVLNERMLIYKNNA